jgi:hypothetical protein
MNIQLQRHNEARRYVKKIEAKYGRSARICDSRTHWYIYTPVRVGPGMWDVQDRMHWSGKFLRDAI